MATPSWWGEPERDRATGSLMPGRPTATYPHQSTPSMSSTCRSFWVGWGSSYPTTGLAFPKLMKQLYFVVFKQLYNGHGLLQSALPCHPYSV